MKIINKTSVFYPIIFILIVLGVQAGSTIYTYAAESFDVSEGTKWVQGDNINSGLRIKTKGGEIAYCLNQGSASPSGAYTDKLSLTSKLKAVLYYGYPNNKKFGTTSLNVDQARCATQLAVWAHDDSGKGNKVDLKNLHGANDKGADGDKVLAAAKWLYKKANSGYKAPTKPTFKAPTVTRPKNNTPQYFNQHYVRVGPYRYTTTNNNYTSDNKVAVNLSDAPAGTRLGNSSGSFVSVPAADTDFYLYIPSELLTKKGSAGFNISISYKYKYEKAATFAAYKKASTQNVAISTTKSYATGKKALDGPEYLKWTNTTLQKSDFENNEKKISDTEFKIYYDPTPNNSSNNDWVFMYNRKTDINGIINVPGLGIGTYKLVEVKANPNYAMNSEFDESDELTFKISNTDTESIQVFKNRAISISAQIDKDTIRKTSAAYKSLPGQEEIDNTGKETYRYHVNYRSTSNVWADEFVVDDPLEGVADNQIRVTELWTPVAYGDNDGKMNIWYKTNKTDDEKLYSNVSAVGSNPHNPNNPKNESVKNNVGYKLWAQDISTTQRSNLKVADLNLEKDEHITAIRLEHGRVERGFTTKNNSSESLNDDGTIDWKPEKDDQFFTEESRDAEGLKPLTYLVMCPNPLSPPEIINNSATSFIGRNVHLTDEDSDKVTTEVIDTFKENPAGDIYPDEHVKGQTAISKVKEHDEVADKQVINVDSSSPKTKDKFPLALMVLIGLAAIGLGIMLKKKSKPKILPVILVALLMTGMFASTGNIYASSLSIGDTFEKNGIEYSLVKATKGNGKGNIFSYKVEYKVNEVVSAKQFEKDGENKFLPKTLKVSADKYNGKIRIENKWIRPQYAKKQRQVDKKEIQKGLDVEDIRHLPTSKVFSVRSDSSVDAKENKELKRAGVSLKVAGSDEDGVPNKWDATIVYRGMESYLEKHNYKVEATYTGVISRASNLVETKKISVADNEDDKTDDGKLTEEEKKEIVEKVYKDYKGIDDLNEPAPKQESTIFGIKTADFMKGLSVFLTLIIVSTIIFIIAWRRRHMIKCKDGR